MKNRIPHSNIFVSGVLERKGLPGGDPVPRNAVLVVDLSVLFDLSKSTLDDSLGTSRRNTFKKSSLISVSSTTILNLFLHEEN